MEWLLSSKESQNSSGSLSSSNDGLLWGGKLKWEEKGMRGNQEKKKYLKGVPGFDGVLVAKLTSDVLVERVEMLLLLLLLFAVDVLTSLALAAAEGVGTGAGAGAGAGRSSGATLRRNSVRSGLEGSFLPILKKKKK